jgi:predicted Fe-S protein YdhL (DUF1289 family)
MSPGASDAQWEHMTDEEKTEAWREAYEAAAG